MKAKNKLIKRLRKEALLHPDVEGISVEYSSTSSEVLVVIFANAPSVQAFNGVWDSIYDQLVVPNAEEASHLGVTIGIE